MHFKADNYIFIKPTSFLCQVGHSPGILQKPAQVFMLYLIKHKSKERHRAARVFNDKLDTFC